MKNGSICTDTYFQALRGGALSRSVHRSRLAASAPVVEESTPEDAARISQIVRGEVGRAINRRRTPEEVFRAAVGVLQSRLIELPSVADSVAKHLGIPTTQIEFQVD